MLKTLIRNPCNICLSGNSMRQFFFIYVRVIWKEISLKCRIINDDEEDDDVILKNWQFSEPITMNSFLYPQFMYWSLNINREESKGFFKKIPFRFLVLQLLIHTSISLICCMTLCSVWDGIARVAFFSAS